ncbi:DUF4158 domain-containing protein [Streptomyces sp. NPDC001970]
MPCACPLRFEFPGKTVEFVALQVQAPASELGAYEWTGRTVEYHRAQIRKYLGFRERSAADADTLTAWLTEQLARKERPNRYGWSFWPTAGRRASSRRPLGSATGSCRRGGGRPRGCRRRGSRRG